jgi:predicted DNA binding CopG/RHH family protein
MEQPANSRRSEDVSSFAGLLASLAAPNKVDAGRESDWNDHALGEDVVTLSYEQALRNHARYRVDERGDLLWPAANQSQPDVARPAQTDEALEQAIGRDLRTESVTIRLSKAECARLRQRATEAGLTVSAYLRSCVLEADALRAQVKEALAEMKTTPATESAAVPSRGSWSRWMGRLTKGKH